MLATLLSLIDDLSSCTRDLRSDEKGSRVLVVAATNRIESIDAALRRPGRFDCEIEVGEPCWNLIGHW